MNDHDMQAATEKPAAARRKPRIFPWLILFALVLALGAIYGVRSRHASDEALATWTKKQSIPSVDTVTAQLPTEVQHLVLPADVEAFYTAPIHARVNGYVKMWYHDIGARVKAGEVLAEIDTPELDQQVAQAQGELDKAKADLELADLTSARWASLRKSQAVSQQTADEKAGDAVAHKAQVIASQANLDRLKALTSFKKISAPFAGTVTGRHIDIGALVSSTAAGQPALFDVAMTKTMRVYVRVPQVFTANMRPGMPVTLKLPQFPNRIFAAKLSTTSDAVSAESRALLVELSADNPNGDLAPGAYAQARFDLPLDKSKLILPANAVIFRDKSPEVAVVEADGHVALKPIDILLDTGNHVQIANGLSLEDRIVVSPSDSLAEGDAVDVASVNGKSGAGGAVQASNGAAK